MLDLTERFGVLRWDDSSGMVVQWNGTCSNLWSPNQQIWNITLRGKEWFDSLHEVTPEQVYYKTGSPGLHHSDTVRALRKQASSGATLEQTQQTPDPVYEIQKVAYENLTFKEFHDFRVQDRPLVITGVPREHRTCFGGLRDYSDLRFRDCNGSVHVNVITDGEGQRKGSRVVGTMPFQEFLSFFRRRAAWSRVLAPKVLSVALLCNKTTQRTIASGSCAPSHGETCVFLRTSLAKWVSTAAQGLSFTLANVVLDTLFTWTCRARSSGAPSVEAGNVTAWCPSPLPCQASCQKPRAPQLRYEP